MIKSAAGNWLRPYQIECVNESLKCLRLGVVKQLASLPVGAGKTVILAHLLNRVPPPTVRAQKSLVLAHREELIDQAYRQITRYSTPYTRIAIDQGDRHADVANSDVIVASVQSLFAQKLRRLAKYDPAEFKCVIVDEVCSIYLLPTTNYQIGASCNSR
jgi:ATP-dependent helicase IRC3